VIEICGSVEPSQEKTTYRREFNEVTLFTATDVRTIHVTGAPWLSLTTLADCLRVARGQGTLVPAACLGTGRVIGWGDFFSVERLLGRFPIPPTTRYSTRLPNFGPKHVPGTRMSETQLSVPVRRPAHLTPPPPPPPPPPLQKSRCFGHCFEIVGGRVSRV
jgi:hypothetical protein